ncbi:MAG: deoxyguanosinetriphosphate triphosphohydrolase, partial [Jatrophihabitans sp.]
GGAAGGRFLEALVRDWAYDIAYWVHDVVEGVHGGLIRLGTVDDAAREVLCTIAAAQYSPLSAEQLAPVLDELLDLPTLRDLAEYDGSHRAQAAAKRATSELTGRFAGAAVAATRAAHGGGPLARYDADLVVPAGIAAECALLKAIAVHYVMRRPVASERQGEQRALLTELVELIRAGAPGTLDRSLHRAWHASGSDAERLRVVVDQVAQLTDSSAVARHARLTAAAPVHIV